MQPPLDRRDRGVRAVVPDGVTPQVLLDEIGVCPGRPTRTMLAVRSCAIVCGAG